MSDQPAPPPTAHRTRELPGAIVLAAVALFFFVGSLRLPFGSTARLGPGYFPLMLSLVLFGLAGVIAFNALAGRDKPGAAERANWRPFIFIVGAMAVFGAVVKMFGLVPAIVATVAVASMGDRESRPLGVALLALGLALFVWLVFIKLLGVTIPPFRVPA